MANYARVESQIVVEISPNPYQVFCPELAQRFMLAPDEVTVGYMFINGKWEPPPVVPPQELSNRE